MSPTEPSFDVIVFPADGRAPHLAVMPVTQDFSTFALYNAAPTFLPRPEVHMQYIADGTHAHGSIVRPVLCAPARPAG